MYIIYKNEGETPLQSIKRNFSDGKFTYAGRLDPMAKGLLLILSGEECKYSKKFWGLKKTYRYKIMPFFETDSLDILGKIIKNGNANIDIEKIEKMVGKIKLRYPVYSSQIFNGKPLFEYAKNGIDIGEQEYIGEVLSHKFIKKEEVNFKEVIEKKIKAIENIDGDFRKEEIIKQWRDIDIEKIILYEFEIEVKGGVYVRSIIEKINRELKTPSCAFSIDRIAIGDFTSALAKNPLPLDKFL